MTGNRSSQNPRNVPPSVTDRKHMVDTNGDRLWEYNLADVYGVSDYYPGGMLMPGRSYSSDKYRFGMNGQEKDDEIAGSGNIYSAEYWEYDSRSLRRWNIDPVETESESPYLCFSGNPIWYSDPDGDYSRVGAWMRNLWNGGKGISKTESTGEWGYEVGNGPGVEYKDGLKKAERQAKIDKYKENHYLTEEGKWAEIPTISAYKPNVFDNWSESKFGLGKIIYGILDPVSVSLQNIFTKNLIGDGNAYHLNGSATNPNENVDAFIDATSLVIPEAKASNEITVLKTVNASQFSKMFKGSLSRLNPSIRGYVNKAMNNIYKSVNKKVSSGKVVKDGVELIKKVKD